ncbi:MAG: hypothetical protein JXA22_01735 [Candidatus Thermoplasmatota archaeon]|nr:hypothetical protein [Candidatus Thermoplasmatota archaeon]
MRTTIEVNAGEYLREIEKICMEQADRHSFPTHECAVCGSSENIGSVEVNSMKLQGPRKIPVCNECRSYLESSSVEDLLRSLKKRGSFQWTMVVAHNIRKTNWISRLTFEVMRE